MNKIIIAIALLLVSVAPVFADGLKEKHVEEKRAKEVAKAEKRAAKAIDWSFEHRDKPMPVANIKAKCE